MRRDLVVGEDLLDLCGSLRRADPHHQAPAGILLHHHHVGLAKDQGGERLRRQPLDFSSLGERSAWRLAGRNRTISVPYATEAGRFQKAGIPTVVCGPGSIDQAHQPDEWISLDALAQGEALLRRLIQSCRG